MNKTANTPFDRDEFRQEVEARLDEIGKPRLSAAFAARVALASLPLLAIPKKTGPAEAGFLWFWPEEKREKHLLAVCRALQVGWSLTTDFSLILDTDTVTANIGPTVDVSDVNAAAVSVSVSAISVSIASTNVAIVSAIADQVNKSVTNAAAAAAYAASADNNLIPWIRQELQRLGQTLEFGAYLDDPSFPQLPLQRAFLSQLRQLSNFDYWADWLQDRYDGRPIDPAILEKTVSLPEEIRAQDPRAINRYLAELTGGKRQEKIKRVRAIFIGNGEAGKTSLISALNGEAVTEGGADMTRGIEISEWPLPDSDLTAHFWDFGGQVIAHATHQFFLRARCVYVLVLNARSADSNPNQQAEYWLEFVRAFGADAPVLLVGNKCDLAPVNVDLNRLRESYPNIQGFHGLSSTQYRGRFAREFGIFRDAFVAQLARAGESARLYFSRNEFAFIAALRAESRRNSFLEKAAFEARCDEYGIAEGERRRGFLDLLDQLGEVIHFPELYRAGFREYLLNPRWLTQGVYRLLYSDLLKDRHGLLRRGDVHELLEGRAIEEDGHRLAYPEDRLDFLIRAMEQFKLCYPAPNAKDAWIVPDLLPSDQPASIGFERRGALRFDFRFQTFLPRHVLNQFIVAHYRDIEENRAWQHGVSLESRKWRNTRALARADYQSRVLKLEVVGDQVDSYFAVLYDSILDILERMPRLKHDQQLHLDEAARIGEKRIFSDEEPTADFGSLLVHKAEGRREFLCEFGKYDLQRLLHLMQSETTGDHRAPNAEKKTERKAMKFWRERLGDLGSLASLLSLFG
uniref:non-specific serine/threonine protein kinase n=1 Tax=Candidatus Kentrum sp. TC TaxID=2126339 RepID=A0A450ZTU7_9GAMM|nr:MAG: Ras of Complex, Roc, domain of DAPkinase [Candidatus Kentron sp. TC]